MTSSKPYTLWRERGFEHKDSLDQALSVAYVLYTSDDDNSVDCIECPDGTVITGNSPVWLDYLKKRREGLREAIERARHTNPTVGWVEIQAPNNEWHREYVCGDAAGIEPLAEKCRAIYGPDRVKTVIADD